MGALQAITKIILPRSSSAALWRLLYFIALLIFSTSLVAQVKIQERVRISPVASPKVSGFSTHTTPYYTPCGPALADTSLLDLTFLNWYGDTTFVQHTLGCFPGSDQYFMNVDFIRGTEYVRVVDNVTGENVGYHYTTSRYQAAGRNMIFDQLAPQDTAVVTYVISPIGPLGCPVEISHIIVFPRFRLIPLPITPYLFHAEGVFINVDATAYDCIRGIHDRWLPLSDLITYNAEIVSGQQYGTLVNTQTGDSAPALAGLGHDTGLLTSLKFLANGEVPESTVQATFQISTSDTSIEPIEIGFVILPPLCSGPPSQLFLSADPSYITTGEVARLYAIAFDSCGNELRPDNALHLSLEVTAGTVYGSFLTAAGDTVPSPLSDVLYEDLRSGSIGFLANGVVPDSITPVTIRVSVPGTSIAPAEAVVLVDAPSCPLIVSMPSQITPGDTAALTVVRRRENGVTDLYPPDQLFDLSINDGVGAGLLVAPDGTTDPNSLSCTPQGIRFAAADSIGGDSVRVEFRVQECSGGSSGPSLEGGKLDPLEECAFFGEVWIKNRESCTLVAITPDTLAPGDTASITVMEERSDGTTVPYPPETLFSVSLVAGQGTLLSISGETSTTTLECTPQGFRYIAPENVSESFLEIHISVRVAQGCGGMQPVGSQSSSHIKRKGPSPTYSPTECLLFWPVWIKKKNQLTIVNHSPHEIWPEIPEHQRINLTGYDPQRSFQIRVTGPNGEPLADELVRIQTDFVQRSGGHQHDLGAVEFPRGVKQGDFKMGNSSRGNPTVEVATDHNGELTLQYTASQVSGEYTVTAFTVADTTIKDTVHLRVRVPGLVNFRYLIVLYEEPFTFAQTPPGEANHPSPGNTWCTPEMGNNLFLAILDFYEWTRSAKGGGIPIRTSINDMSLQLGGYFDVRANWDVNATKPKHLYHRIGFSVDINNNGIKTCDANGRNCQLTRLGKQLVEFMKDRKGEIHKYEDPIHFGFLGRQ